MKQLLGILFFCGIISTSWAQRSCGTEEYVRQMIQANPSLQNAYNKLRTTTLLSRPDNAAHDTAANQVINIPIVIHVLYNTDDQNISDAQILSQFVVLNQDYRRQNADTASTPGAFKPFAADAKFQFCLAQVDPKGNRTSGIIRKYTTQQLFITDDAMKYSAQGGDDAWDCTKYLNIWVCNLISRSLGYTTPPGGPADRDGVVIGYNVFGNVGNLRAPFDKGRTATHEIGHWLGLIHTWGDADCGNDSVADTPQQEAYNFGCPSFPHISSCSPDGNGDMFMDFMDFSDDACMNLFTAGQVKRMRSFFALNNVRNSFLVSYECDSTSAQGGPLPTGPTPDTIVTAQVVKVYPNPAHGQLIVECNEITKLAPQTLHVYNIVGMQVFEAQLIQSKTTLNLTSLLNGIYIIKLGENKNGFVAKIVLE